jgi:hypothetical protein
MLFGVVTYLKRPRLVDYVLVFKRPWVEWDLIDAVCVKINARRSQNHLETVHQLHEQLRAKCYCSST